MKGRLGYACVFGLMLASAVQGQVVFADDFDRPDGPVGNGWLDSAGNIDGDMAIESNRAVGTGCDSGIQGIHRPLVTTEPLRIQCVITETDGFDLIGSRFENALVIDNNGGSAYSDGYGLYLNRTEADSNNSRIQRLDNGGAPGSINSPFQFDSELTLDFTIYPNGQITGTITEGVNVFNFSLPPYVRNASGGHFAYGTNLKANGSTMPQSFDDLVLTEEPAECFLVIGTVPGAETVQPDGYAFETQVGGVESVHYVLTDSIPEFVLPGAWPSTTSSSPGLVGGSTGPELPSAVPSWMWDGHFVVQVVMYNPDVFPQQPEQCTGGLAVHVAHDGTVSARPYGAAVGGMDLAYELDVNADGDGVIRFPFTVAGL